MDINYEFKFLKNMYRFNNGICYFTVLVLLFLAIQVEAAHYDILAFGDSITQGVKKDGDGVKSGILSPPGGIRTIDGYEPELELLAKSTPDTVYVYNWGYGGERTNDGLNRIDSVLASRSAQYILVMEGANDILAGISTATTTFNLSQMVVKSREAFIEPILATVTPNTTSGASGKNDVIANDLNVKIKQLALNNEIVLADQYKNLSPPPDGTGWVTIYNSGDGLHLSDEGERRVAQTWFDSLLQSPFRQFQQDLGDQGIVSIEAEHFHASTQYSNHNWTLKALAGSSGNKAMDAAPNSGVSITANYAPLNSPRLDFDVNFVKTGTHYIWVRGYGPNLGGDSIHIGLDNIATPSAGSMKSFSPTKSWVWCGDAEGTGIVAPATINIPSTGIHTINAWMREDGFIFDKIVITTDVHYVPTGLGPGESPNLDSGDLEQYSPQITSTAPDSGIVNNVYQYDVNAAGLPEPSFVLANGPVGMVINPATGQLSWTPDAVGTYSVTVIAQNSMGSDSQSFTIMVLDQSTLPSDYTQFQQDLGDQGIVSIEAEHYHASTPYSNHNWTLKALAGSSGNKAMDAAPNSRVSITANYAPLNSPRLDFDVNFVKTGTHYIWVRGYGPNLGGDSIHIGLDNTATPSAGSMKSFSPTKSWVWCGDAEGTGIIAPATINIPSTGIHTINAWMREDGFIFDKIVITTDVHYVPTGLGPGESPNLDSGDLEQYSPQITSTAPDSGIVNNVYQYDVNAAGLPEPSFALANGPVGMVINSATGQLSWTPNAVGTYSVTVIAQNSRGSDSQSFTVTVLGQSTLPSGLVSYWTLDETGGSIFQDETGQNIGQCTTNCPKAIVGLVDGGQHFNGTQRINVASDNSLDWSLGESFSLEFWMRKSTITIENEPIIDRYDKTSNAHWWAGVGHAVNPGKARFYVRDRAGKSFGVSGTTPLTDGLWHHVVAVQDALKSELRIYVDGVLEGTASTSYSSDFVMPSTPVTIGQAELPSSVTMDFIGDLDEVTVYSRIMSFNEIGAHFDSGYLGSGYF